MKFTKLQALGNDFLVIDSLELPSGVVLDELARGLCDRHYGAGGDGIVVVSREVREDADCSSRIFNADGSEAEVSGNGTRCLAAWLDAAGHWPENRDTVRIATAAGVKAVRLVGRDRTRRTLEMEMGVPRFASRDVPMALDPPVERVVGYLLDVDGERVVVTALSVGNPHCTVLVDDLDAIDFRKIGARIERHELFPQRTNVEFVCVEARGRLRALFWERGAGETLSSGTGASAATVAAIVNGLADRSVTVETPAGALRVTWREVDDVVVLSGPAEVVYTAEWLRSNSA